MSEDERLTLLRALRRQRPRTDALADLIHKLKHAQTPRRITITVQGGAVHWTVGNALPFRLRRYAGDNDAGATDSRRGEDGERR